MGRNTWSVCRAWCAKLSPRHGLDSMIHTVNHSHRPPRVHHPQNKAFPFQLFQQTFASKVSGNVSLSNQNCANIRGFEFLYRFALNCLTRFGTCISLADAEHTALRSHGVRRVFETARNLAVARCVSRLQGHLALHWRDRHESQQCAASPECADDQGGRDALSRRRRRLQQVN
jgi:hypothetical protein